MSTQTRARAPETPETQAPAPESKDALMAAIDEIAEQKANGRLEWKLAEYCQRFRQLDEQSGTARLSRNAVSSYAGTFATWCQVPAFQALPYRLARIGRKHASEELVTAFLSGGEAAFKQLMPPRKASEWAGVIEACSRALSRGVKHAEIIAAVNAL